MRNNPHPAIIGDAIAALNLYAGVFGQSALGGGGKIHVGKRYPEARIVMCQEDMMPCLLWLLLDTQPLLSIYFSNKEAMLAEIFHCRERDEIL